MDALSAEILSSYEAKLTASYSETYTQGTNAGVTVAVTDGEHGTVTSGESTHSHPGHVVAEILSDYSAQLTIGFSETYSSGSNAAVTVAVTEGEHATVTRGKSCQPACCPYLAISHHACVSLNTHSSRLSSHHPLAAFCRMVLCPSAHILIAIMASTRSFKP